MSEQKQSAQAIWDELDEQDRGDSPGTSGEPVSKAVEAEPGKEPAKGSDAPASNEGQPNAATPSAEDGFNKRFDALEQMLKTTAGRVGALQSELQKRGNQAASTVADAPSQQQIAAASKNPEKWARMKEDFPEWAEAVEELVSTRAAPSGDSAILAGKLSEVETRLAQYQKEREEEQDDAVAYMLRDEDWKASTATPEFKAWFDAKPEEERKRLLESNRVTDVVRTIKAFKEHKAAAAQPQPQPKQDDTKSRSKRERLAASVMPSGTNPPPTKSVEEMSDQEYWDYLDEKERREQARG